MLLECVGNIPLFILVSAGLMFLDSLADIFCIISAGQLSLDNIKLNRELLWCNVYQFATQRL